MKKRISTVVVNLLLSCFFAAGCTPLPAYIAIDSQSEVMNPTFCIYDDQYFQERLRIRSIKVEKILHAPEEKKQLKLNLLQNNRQTVWELESGIVVRLWGWFVSSLRYGEVPRGYAEKVKALPLEPEELYSVEMGAYGSRGIAPLRFMIRLSETDIPDRLEYSRGIPFYMWADIFDQTRAHLNLD